MTFSSRSLSPDEGHGDITNERQFSGGCSECCGGGAGGWSLPSLLASTCSGEEKGAEGPGPAEEGRGTVGGRSREVSVCMLACLLPLRHRTPHTRRVASLQQEVASLRAKVKGTKEKVRGYEGQVAGMASLRAEMEQQQQAMRSELRSVKAEVRGMHLSHTDTDLPASVKCCVRNLSAFLLVRAVWQLTSTEEHLKREAELRTEAEFLSKSLQRGQWHCTYVMLCAYCPPLLPTLSTARALLPVQKWSMPTRSSPPATRPNWTRRGSGRSWSELTASCGRSWRSTR